MPRQQRVTFTGANGADLAGALHIPDRPQSRGTVLFAHCFTCDKNSLAASRISRALAALGFHVLRFDFTGLGGSEGDFGNTGFISNVDDIHAAAAYLADTLEAPSILIGHSLGGTAMLAAAAKLPDARAVVTIGSPAAPKHVTAQFGESSPADGDSVRLSIGGREFLVCSDFVDRFDEPALMSGLDRLKKALLVFHAPLDTVVAVDEASKIFQAARHPKSFVSLDGADHLLTDPDDARYVADTIDAWVSRYLPDEAAESAPDAGEVRVGELNTRFLRSVAADDHRWLADEPKNVGGENLGPDPYEHLLAALGTCTSMTIRMYANRKKLPLEDVVVDLRHERVHADDCEECEDRGGRLDVIRREIALVGDLSNEERTRLLEIADRCPVHRTLENDPVITTELVESPGANA